MYFFIFGSCEPLKLLRFDRYASWDVKLDVWVLVRTFSEKPFQKVIKNYRLRRFSLPLDLKNDIYIQIKYERKTNRENSNY